MLYKRGEIWWYSIYVGSRRIRKSTGTKVKAEAKLIEANKLAEYSAVRHCNKIRKTWAEGALQFLEDSRDKSSLADIERHIGYLNKYLSGKFLDEIDHSLIELIIQSRQKEGASPATINRYMSTLRAILNSARKRWQWIEAVPHVRRLKEPQGKERFLTLDEADRLLDAADDYLKPIIIFALATGARRGNILGLRWDQIDLDRREWVIPAESFKNRTKHVVPLNDDAMKVLKGLTHNNQDYVFTFRGRRLYDCKSAFNRAAALAGLPDLRFHDLRHTFASWFLQAGNSLVALKAVCGWKSIEMAFRYSHYSRDSLHSAVNSLSKRHNLGTKLVIS